MQNSNLNGTVLFARERTRRLRSSNTNLFINIYDTKVDITNSEGNIIIIINRSMDNKRVDGLTTCMGSEKSFRPGKRKRNEIVFIRMKRWVFFNLSISVNYVILGRCFSRSNFVISKGTSHPGVIFCTSYVGLLIQEIKIGSLSSFEGNTFSFAPNK